MSDPVTRLNAALEGSYHIERRLGEGGMATVYLADDVRHERKVALKVLKPELAAVIGADRFLAEIKTTANLQHPHILPLFDSGEADTFLFYVMPYVEGETLEERIDRERQLPVEEAVQIATNMAEALDYAHRQGVVHRDIKPANVLMLDGKPVIADFGIALALGTVGEGRLTETGLSLGTPHYMSPEQATGDQGVGPPTDIYALGCVLYEMLIGEPPYTGSTVQAMLGKIIAGKLSPAGELRPATPPNVDGAIRKALEKLPADRFRGAQQFVQALADSGFRHGAVVLPVSNRPTLVLASVAVVLAIALAWVSFGLERGPPTTINRYNLNLGPIPILAERHSSRVVVSPDGSSYVFSGPRAGYQLWLRRQGELEPTPLLGTEGGFNPTFSPDGQRVAFLVGQSAEALRVVSLQGETPVELIRGNPNRLGHSWSPDGHIYLGSDEGLRRVGEGGGSLEPVTQTNSDNGETGHMAPFALPNGRGVLFTVFGTPSSDMSQYQIAVADPNTGEYRVLVPGVRAQYSDTGHLVYVSADGTLLAAKFDQDRLETNGPSVALINDVSVGQLGSLDLDLSSSGNLIYRKVSGGGETELVYVGRDGAARVIDPGWTGEFSALALSPDGTRLALEIGTSRESEVWVKELDRGSALRLSFEGTIQRRPEWLPDGQSVSYPSDRRALLDIWMRRADGSGIEQLVLDRDRGTAEGFWSPDGRWLIYRTDAGGAGSGDILMSPRDGDGEPTALLDSNFSELAPALSGDGKWLAYSSDETGVMEVYVVPFPDAAAQKWRISNSGGTEPVWAHSGQELFYRNAEGDMVSVAVRSTPSFQHGDQEVLFSALPYVGGRAHRVYDVTPDDQRFIMVRVISSGSTGDLVVVEGFSRELEQRVPN